MVKGSSVCPFSGMSCRECPIYRGRHSQLCIAARYRNGVKPEPTYGCTHLKFEFPDELVYSENRFKNLEDREEHINAAEIVWRREQR